MILDKRKINMIEAFILNPNIKTTASQIAKKNNLNQKSTQLFLNSLEKQKLLTSEYQGKNKLFFWNKNNSPLIKEFILVVEHLRTLSFYQKQPLLKNIINKIKPYVNGTLILFGSYADNTATTKSDIDLLIIGNYEEDKILEITKTFNTEISIKHLKKYEENPLTKEVQSKHILLKNAETYIIEAIPWIN